MKGTNKKSFAIWCLVMGCALGGRVVIAGYIPTPGDVRTGALGEECAVLRSLEGRTRTSMTDVRTQLASLKTGLQSSRTSVEECGARKGLAKNPGGWDEAALAELCPGEFGAWLELGYRFHALREDLEENDEGLDLLVMRLHRACGRLPMPVAVTHPE